MAVGKNADIRVDQVAGVDRLKLDIVEDVIGIPVLGGKGVNRTRERLYVRICGGALHTAADNEEIVLEDDGALAGWGPMDCERSVVLRITATGREVNTHPNIISQLRRNHGLG